ncbi:unnamed protein product [Ectocarpus sp. 4 AP-2014]
MPFALSVYVPFPADYVAVVIFSRRQHIKQMCFIQTWRGFVLSEGRLIYRSSLAGRAQSIVIATLAKAPAYLFVAFFALGIRKKNNSYVRPLVRSKACKYHRL